MGINPKLVLKKAREINPNEWTYSGGKTSAQFQNFTFQIREYSHEPSPYNQQTAYELKVLEEDRVLIELDSQRTPELRDLYLSILARKRDSERRNKRSGLNRLEKALSR